MTSIWSKHFIEVKSNFEHVGRVEYVGNACAVQQKELTSLLYGSSLSYNKPPIFFKLSCQFAGFHFKR